MSLSSFTAFVGPAIDIASTVGGVIARTVRTTNNENNFSPEGLVNLVELALIDLLPDGTLLGFENHTFKNYPPGLTQGPQRQNDNQRHEDLSILDDHLTTIMHRICDKENSQQEIADLQYIGNSAVNALVKINTTYKNKYGVGTETYKQINIHIERAITVIKTHINPETASFSDSKLDNSIRKSHKVAGSLRYIADQFSLMKNPDYTEIKNSCIKTIYQWSENRIVIFEALRNQILKKA